MVALGLETFRLIFELIFVDLTFFFYYLLFFKIINIMNFEFYNQFWWLTMIVHLKYYKNLEEDDEEEYFKVRKKIRCIENTIVTIFIINLIISNLAWAYMAYIQLMYKWVYK